jgi:putative acetyltransferase
MLRYQATDSSNPDFIALVRQLDAELAERDGADHAFYAQFNKIAAIKHAMLIYEDEVPVACGAFKPFDDESVEIKRMYVLLEKRGKGLATEVLKQLEQWAAALGYQSCVLETGKRQPHFKFWSIRWRGEQCMF